MSSVINGTAIIIAYDWPTNSTGYRLAVKSSLKQYVKFFEHVIYVGLVDQPFDSACEWESDNVEFIYLPVIRSAPWKRFLKSLSKTLPAITMQFTPQPIKTQLMKIVSSRMQLSQKNALIFEDVHTTCLLSEIKEKYPDLPIAIRSHNVNTKAFESFTRKGNLLNRLAWRLEVSKIARFEQRVCREADRVWAISEWDKYEYQKRLDVNCDGVFGISLDVDRYAQVEIGDFFTVLYIGTTDMRKTEGLWQFINYGWVEIRNTFPSARFLLAGENTEQFTNKDRGIQGLGFVDDDRLFLSKGAIFLNPQEDGSGVKLKSIIAMLAGKALVSTETGIEGIPVNAGKHFLIAPTAKELAPKIINLMSNHKQIVQLSESARQFVRHKYTDASLYNAVNPLLTDFISLNK